MSDVIRRLIAFVLVVVLAFCFASCKDNGDEPDTVPYASSDETQDATDISSTTQETTTQSSLSTVALVTREGGTVPTVVTSQWNTTLPTTTATPASVTETSTNLTMPTAYSTMPIVISTILPSTERTTGNQSSGSNGSTGPTVDGNTTKTPHGSDSTVTTAPTTQAAVSKPKELMIGITFIDADDNFVLEFEGDGWSKSLKSSSAKIDISVDGKVIKGVRVNAPAALNADGRIEITLVTGKLGISSGDEISFTLPEGLVRTADGSYYSIELPTTQVIPQI